VSYNGRGLAHYYKEEFDLAITDYNKGIALDPNAIIYSNRGHARSQKKD
jgi:tetratricopeptide (TPR) repeat protein